jgi:hypothetical protein
MVPRSLAASVAAVFALVGCDPGPRAPEPSPPAASELVRDGARPVRTVTGDLDGDGTPEVVVASVDVAAGDLGVPIPYLEVFDLRGRRWTRVFDATGNAPPGEGTPAAMLVSAGEGFVNQSVATLDVVDFGGDGPERLVVGIANAGATSGPLEVWIISMGPDGRLATDFYEASERGGEITVDGNRVRFRFGVYRNRDPGCCPSRMATQTIGWNPDTDRIEVLHERVVRTREP